MPTRTARTAWNGGLQDGSGQVELTSSGVGTFEVDFPKRASDDPQGVTSPEELIAAGHSACFAMSLSNELAQAGGTPHGIEVTTEVDLGPDAEHGGFVLTAIRLKAVVEVDGLDDQGFAKGVAAAEAGCPVSKALRAVDITVEASRA
ncbi:MAG TPA: OsmC family peroxiredoxin [Mycobacteriales bacterium]|nr:OsmC family peroxiredoxin [Mycobacteriales bacterium]